MATTFKLFGAQKVIAWVLGTSATVGAAIADGVVTAITVAAGEGAAFADASTVNPHKIKIDNEIMWVVGRASDTLTVQRAKDSTTAVGHSNGAAIMHLIPVRIPKVFAFTMSANIETIEFPGDGDVERVFQPAGIDGTVGMSKFATDLIEKVGGVPPVTTGLHSDEAVRYHPELGDYAYSELHVDMKAENETTGANGTVRTTIYLAKLQDPFILGDAGNNEAQQTTFNWSSQATMLDLWGLPIPGVTAEEVHYAYSVLA